MEKKFIKKYYKVGSNHFQVRISEDKFLEAKLHKDGTYDLLLSNPKFTKPILGKKILPSEALKEKSPVKMKHEYIHDFFMVIGEMAKSFTELSVKSKAKK